MQNCTVLRARLHYGKSASISCSGRDCVMSHARPKASVENVACHLKGRNV